MTRTVALEPRRTVMRGAFVAAFVSAMLTAGGAAAQTGATPGAVLQQTAPAPVEAAVPAAPIVLPARQGGKSGSSVQIPVSKLEIVGNHLIPTDRLHALVASAEGKTLTLDELNALVHRITGAYHAAGYPVAYAYLPAQTVRHGVIRIAVVEPTYDRVEVTGTSRFKQTQARATLGIKPGETVAEAPLSRGLLLLQETPGVIVNGVLMPGAAPGTTSLKVTGKDLPVLSGQLSLTNHGNGYTGGVLSQLSVTAADPFGLGSAISANTSLSMTGDLVSGGINAVSPDLGDGLRVGAYGSWTGYRLGGPFKVLDQSGQALQLGADLTYPLLLAPGRRLDLRVDLVDNQLKQETGSTGTEARQHLTIGRVALSGAQRDATGGVTSGRLALNVGTLSLAPAAARAADAAGPGAAGTFAIVRFRLTRQQPLPAGFALKASVSGQLANRNLDSSQKFFLGGPDGVMSTDVGAGGGDDGLLMQLQLSHALATGLPGELRLSGLAQWGVVQVNHTQYAGASTPNHLSAGAIGLGLSYRQDRWSLDAAAAAPLGGSDVQAGGRAWVSASVGF